MVTGRDKEDRWDGIDEMEGRWTRRVAGVGSGQSGRGHGEVSDVFGLNQVEGTTIYAPRLSDATL